MSDMNPRAVMGGNNPPDPLDTALAPFGDQISESENWLDGKLVENEGQMNAVDALLKQIKEAEKAVTAAREAEAKPLHEAWKSAIARYKPTQDDLERIRKGLIALVDGFKRKLAAERAEAELAARAEAERKMREAQAAAAAAAANAADIEAQREAAMAQYEAEKAAARAAAASKDGVNGLRTVTRYEITDHRALLNWIAVNNRDAITAFIEEWARKNHKQHRAADGLRVWEQKVAY